MTWKLCGGRSGEKYRMAMRSRLPILPIAAVLKRSDAAQICRRVRDPGSAFSGQSEKLNLHGNRLIVATSRWRVGLRRDSFSQVYAALTACCFPGWNRPCESFCLRSAVSIFGERKRQSEGRSVRRARWLVGQSNSRDPLMFGKIPFDINLSAPAYET